MGNRDILAIGTSAGGVEALLRLVGGLPADLPACVLVTIHPSAVLRSDDRASAYAGLKSDLAVAVRSLG